MKWVGTPISPSLVIRNSEMRLLITPLPVIVPFFWLLNAVASSLKYWTMRPGLGPLEQDLGLALVDAAAAGHFLLLGGRRDPSAHWAGIWRKSHAPGLGKNPLKKMTLPSYSSFQWRPQMAQQITYDKAYDAVAPDDFESMLEVRATAGGRRLRQDHLGHPRPFLGSAGQEVHRLRRALRHGNDADHAAGRRWSSCAAALYADRLDDRPEDPASSTT